MNKVLSIITINYNNADGLRQTIESVVGQTCFDAVEYIVIDDGSSDGSVDVVKKYADRLSFWTTRPNKGIYATMNEGVSHATCQYCVFLNSGDCYHSSDVLEMIIPELTGEFDYVIGRLIHNVNGTRSQIGKELTLLYFIDGCIPQNTSFVKLDLLHRHPFDEKYRIASDFKFFVETVVKEDASYKYVDVDVVDFDCDGISSRNRELANMERDAIFNELFPQAVMADYRTFKSGGGYKNTVYDSFFIKIRNYKFGDVLYSMDVIIMKFISLFKKSVRFVRKFPNKYR